MTPPGPVPELPFYDEQFAKVQQEMEAAGVPLVLIAKARTLYMLAAMTTLQYIGEADDPETFFNRFQQLSEESMTFQAYLEKLMGYIGGTLH